MVTKYTGKREEPEQKKEEKPKKFDTVTKVVGSLNAKVQAKLKEEKEAKAKAKMEKLKNKARSLV